MRTTLGLTILAALAAPALAQPKGKGGEKPPADDKPAPTGDKGDAKSLLASGLKLFAAKDYLGALSVFETAYARFPSPKILLNIGTTLIKLERKADAANAYQGYLDSPDADPAKIAEVTKVLAGLDLEVGLVELSVTPGDAELQLDKNEWLPAAKLARRRVTPGSFVVRARKDGFEPAEQSSTVAAGGTRTLALTLDEVPKEVMTTNTGTQVAVPVGTGVRTGVAPERPPSKLGFLAAAHVDPKNKGGAAILGITFDLASRFQVQAAALLGPSSGGYAGATFALMTGKVKPVLVAGVPVFVANGARVAVRGAAGVELVFNRHIAAVAELGVEHLVNPEAGKTPTLFIPSVGVIGRL